MNDLSEAIRALAREQRRGNEIDAEWEARAPEVAFRQRAKASPGLARALAEVLPSLGPSDARYACWLCLDVVPDGDLPVIAAALERVASADARVVATLALLGRTKAAPPWLHDAIGATLADAAPKASRNQSAVIDILRRAHESPMNFELGEALRHGGRLFNAGKFYEAHEAWEDVWRPMHGAERDFFRGLIQLAVAMKKAREGNPAGVVRLLERVDALLAPYEPSHRGVDVAALRTRVAALRREAEDWLAGRATALTTNAPHLPG